METEEILSPNEESIKSAWFAGTPSIRQIARDHGVSPTWVRKLAAKHGWGPRPELGAQAGAHSGAQSKAVALIGLVKPQEDVEPGQAESEDDGPSETIRKAARSEPDELIDDTREILARLRDELDAVTSHPGELEALIELWTEGDKDPRYRNAMLKAISLPTRILAAKNLALAMKTLTDTGPGKKEQRRRAAETAGMDSLWGNDLDVEIARAN